MAHTNKNINSFAENMRKTITAQTNTLNLLESMQAAVSSKDTFVTYDYTQLKDGSVNTYQLPSFVAINNRIKALETNFQNIASGKSILTLTDGSRRQIQLQNLPKTPNTIIGLTSPTTFKVDSNWFFEDLMFPGLTVNIDLTNQIDESSDRVKVARIILDAKNFNVQEYWNKTLATSDYDYVSLKALLSYNAIPYAEDIETIELPLVSNSLSGTFQITKDPEIIDGLTWYTLDTIKYSSIDENGVNLGTNNILSVGDQLSYNNSLFSVVAIDQNTNKVRLKILNGSAFPGVYTIFTLYQDPFRKKQIDVRFGAHEYNIIYVKGVNEDFNLLSNTWSNPVKFSTDDLVLDTDNNITLKDYYMQNVVDWGSDWIAQAKEKRITAYYGHTPNTPILNASELRVVQINTQVNATLNTADIKQMAADIEETKSLMNSKKASIASMQTELQTITNANEYNDKQKEIESEIADFKNLQTQYSTLVNSFQTSVQANRAVVEHPKYHIRGFFPIPLYQYRDEAGNFPEEIIGFDIKYRYICEDNTANQLNTFTYTDTDGTSQVTGVFSDWVTLQNPIKSRVYNKVLDIFEWAVENVGDGNEININQIDIPITKGEKVEIKARSISEAGYPNNPLKSEWSESIIVEFPSTLNTKNAIADLVEEVNDDALNIAIQNNLDSGGVTAHLSDSIANVNSVSGIYFKHTSDNIAYEDVDEATNTVNTVSLQEKVADLEARLKLLESYLNSQAALIG